MAKALGVPALVAALASLALLSAPASAQAPALAAAPANAAALRGRAAGAQAVTQSYLQLAEYGLVRAQSSWRDRRLGWYDEWLHDRERYPLATIWGIVPLFETLDAIELAAPSRAHRAAVIAFADGAERYFDRTLRSTPGFAPYPGDRGQVEVWFDDNGWWGLAFLDAYRASGNARYLSDAKRAFAFIAEQGWDAAGGGGIWWNTSHPYRAGEALASGTLLAAQLFQITHRASYLAQAKRFIGWAEASFLTEDGLYALTDSNSTPTPYVEGTMIEAQQLLCESGQLPAACPRAHQLADAAWRRFAERINMGTQFDTIYLHWMLVYGTQTGDSRWRALAQSIAGQARTRALAPDGLYLRAWDGSPITEHQARPEMLQTDAATLELFAWLSVPLPRG